MHRTLSAILVVTISISSVPAGASAASGARPQGREPQTGNIAGTATNAQRQHLPQVRVQVRAPNGSVTATGVTNAAGDFSFAGLHPGTYTVEILDAAGNILGTASVSIAAGASATVTVSAGAVGAIAAASGGGISLLGLGTIASFAVLGAAGAIATTAVVATRDEASPSR